MNITTYAEWMREEIRMREINGHKLYEYEDIYNMLDRLYEVDKSVREKILNYVKETETGIDRRPMINIVSDPLEYHIDYLESLDSDVTEKFIILMEKFNLAE